MLCIKKNFSVFWKAWQQLFLPYKMRHSLFCLHLGDFWDAKITHECLFCIPKDDAKKESTQNKMRALNRWEAGLPSGLRVNR